MKQKLTILMGMMLSVLLLTGCGGEETAVFRAEESHVTESTIPASDAISGEPEPVISEVTDFESSTAPADTDSGFIPIADDTVKSVMPDMAVQSTVSADTSARPTVPAQVKGEAAASAMPPSAVSSAAASMPEASSAPPVSQPTTPSESSSPAAAPSQAESQPESSVPSMPVIDIDYYINYAIAYGQSIGLTYLPGESDSWNAPTVINGSNREAVEREIREGLDYTKQIDKHTTFHVWAVKRPDGKYELYGI